jgi:hypothetical protein
MLRKIFILVLCAMASVCVDAGTIRDLFFSEPGELFLQLPENTRKDMIDYYDNGQIVATESNMGDDAQLIKADSSYIALHTSKSRIVEMRLLLKSKRDTVIAVIETVSMPTLDSRISFYTTKWKKLATEKFFAMPTMRDFFRSTTPADVLDKLVSSIAFPMIYMHFEGADHSILVAKPTLREFYQDEDFKRFQPYLVDSLSYNIQGAKIKLLKK